MMQILVRLSKASQPKFRLFPPPLVRWVRDGTVPIALSVGKVSSPIVRNTQMSRCARPFCTHFESICSSTLEHFSSHLLSSHPQAIGSVSSKWHLKTFPTDSDGRFLRKVHFCPVPVSRVIFDSSTHSPGSWLVCRECD